jgi:hypothetical protein
MDCCLLRPEQRPPTSCATTLCQVPPVTPLPRNVTPADCAFRMPEGPCSPAGHAARTRNDLR